MRLVILKLKLKSMQVTSTIDTFQGIS